MSKLKLLLKKFSKQSDEIERLNNELQEINQKSSVYYSQVASGNVRRRDLEEVKSELKEEYSLSIGTIDSMILQLNLHKEQLNKACGKLLLVGIK